MKRKSQGVTRRAVERANGRFAPSLPRPVALSLLFCLMLVVILSGACHRDVEQSLGRAAEAWDSGDYKLAAEEYERYLEQDPTSEKASEARFQLANIYYFKLQRYDQARAHYSTFLERNPTHSNAQLA